MPAPSFQRSDSATTLAFIVVVVVLGANFVAVRYSNDELAPFWGAGFRFASASLLLFGIVAARRIPLPRGRALIGSLLFGTLAFAATYALAYWSLLGAPSGTVAILFATIPLSTLFLARIHGLEPLRPLGIVGGLVAMAGVALLFRQQSTLEVPVAYLLAGLAGAVCAAEAGVVVKYFPRSHPLANNAVAMGTGSLLLLGLSLMVAEPHEWPRLRTTWLALAWLILVGSVLAFALLVHVLGRWPVSTVSYQAVLSPLVTVGLATYLRGEALSWGLAAGGALVLIGVWIAIQSKKRPGPKDPRPV